MKCNERAEEFRNRGNEFFREKKYLEALVAYNESLCCAERESEHVALGFANRSAVYLVLKLYEECLENIKSACDYGYPEDKVCKLKEREEKCENYMKKCSQRVNNDHLSFFKLSHPANPKIPFIVDCLKLQENEKYGCYLITTKDLKTGDVIAIEEPFYKFVDKDVYHSRCANCLKSNKLNLIPCDDCDTSKTEDFKRIKLINQNFFSSHVLLNHL